MVRRANSLPIYCTVNASNGFFLSLFLSTILVFIIQLKNHSLRRCNRRCEVTYLVHEVFQGKEQAVRRNESVAKVMTRSTLSAHTGTQTLAKKPPHSRYLQAQFVSTILSADRTLKVYAQVANEERAQLK